VQDSSEETSPVVRANRALSATAEVTIRYRAFLSYAHADGGWARWLHTRLERFSIDKDFVGRPSALGPVPEVLRPIFRDRDDFSGGHSLTDATIMALDGSAALIVLCSPIAASRPTVNEEVRLFRARHRDRPVIPVIIAGTWPNNFPPALRVELNADGSLSDHSVTILGPDLREAGDGKNLGLAKIVAGLTGLFPDDVFRRAERARRRQNRLFATLAAVFLTVAVAGGFFYWQSQTRQATLAEIAALVDKYSVVSSAQAAVPGKKEGLTEAITAIAEGAATDPRYNKALELLKAGHPDEAEPLLKSVAEDKAKRADKDAKDAAAAYRHLAAIADVSDPKRSREYYAEAARLDPSDMWGMISSGARQLNAGQLNDAEAAFDHVLATSDKSSQNIEALFWAQRGKGDIEQQRGDLAAANSSYLAAKSRAVGQGAIPTWEYYSAQTDMKIGEVQIARGELGSALTTYRNSVAAMELLTKSDPGDTLWQSELAQANRRVGDVQAAQGDLAGAEASYHDSFTITEQLVKSNSENVAWQRELSEANLRIGDVQMTQGDLTGALAAYRGSLMITDRLTKSDPDNRDWQRLLAICYNKLGDLQVASGNIQDAFKSYQNGFDTINRIVKGDPSNARWQRDLWVSFMKLGDMQAKQSNLAGGMDNYRHAVAMADSLAKSDPNNTFLQHDQWSSCLAVGDMQLAQNIALDALTTYQDCLIKLQTLVKSDPSNAVWQRDLSLNYGRIADGYLQTNDKVRALRALQAGQDIVTKLLRISPNSQLLMGDGRWFAGKLDPLTKF
jgi:tetratricopeptide (TPR) repeat protein